MSGVPTAFRFSGLELFLQEFGDQGFQYPLADVGGELLLDQRDRDLAGPKPGQLGTLQNVGDDRSVSLSTSWTGMKSPVRACKPSIKAKWNLPRERSDGRNSMIPRTIDHIGWMLAVSVLAVVALLGLWAAIARRT